ncbi:hypothetical protein H6786_03945 [Candidatus Nomurabacteria bacterium]|nr:hypothetical protein [Candidatus Nomurabacteria bacterium]
MQTNAHIVKTRIAAKQWLFATAAKRQNPEMSGLSYVSLLCRQSGLMT